MLPAPDAGLAGEAVAGNAGAGLPLTAAAAATTAAALLLEPASIAPAVRARLAALPPVPPSSAAAATGDCRCDVPTAAAAAVAAPPPPSSSSSSASGTLPIPCAGCAGLRGLLRPDALPAVFAAAPAPAGEIVLPPSPAPPPAPPPAAPAAPPTTSWCGDGKATAAASRDVPDGISARPMDGGLRDASADARTCSSWRRQRGRVEGDDGVGSNHRARWQAMAAILTALSLLSCRHRGGERRAGTCDECVAATNSNTA